jgi:hypothetical protein
LANNIGSELKKELNLQDFPNVGISYLYRTNPKIYYVFIYSYNKRLPILRSLINKSGVSALYHSNKRLEMSYPIDISSFGGNTSNAYFMVLDLSGHRWNDKTLVESESINDDGTRGLYWKGNLQELTIQDLAGKNTISDFTKAWLKDRNRTQGNAVKSMKLIDCVIDVNKNTIRFQFLSEATELNGKNPIDPDKNSIVGNSSYRDYAGGKQDVNPDNKKIKNNSSKTYELWIEFGDILGKEGWLSVFDGEKISKKDMVDILDSSEKVKLWSSAVSFQYQGFNYWLSQLDGSIVPETRKPKRWDKVHGDGQAFLDKHLASLLNSIKFFSQQMAQKLNKKLKDRGLI